MSGKRALWPVGWHATGMPIQSSSDKLRAEVERFGSQFEKYEEEPVIDGDSSSTPDDANANATREDVTKFTTKKSKATAKTAKLKYQVRWRS